MDAQEAKKQLREMLARMQADKGAEILLFAHRKPKIKLDGKWKDWDMPAVPPAELDELTNAIVQPKQWQTFISGPPQRRSQCHLLALGIGRFKVTAVAYESVLSLSITAAHFAPPARPPADDEHVPFVPGGRPPVLSAEADVEI